MTRRLRVIVPMVLLFALGVTSTGCGLGRTASEVAQDTRRSFEFDAYMLVDDLALLCQTDRPLRTSRWIVE